MSQFRRRGRRKPITPSIVPLLGKLLGAIAIAYVCLCLVLWRGQTRLMFFPSASLVATPSDVQLTYEELRLPVGNGWIHSWWIPSLNPQAPVVLYMHGNGSNLGDLVNRAERFHQWGYGVLLFDYRGYGRSSGPFPNERRVYEDAAVAWAYLTEQRNIPADQIVLYGRSIGGAIALYLAKRHPNAAGVILESPFTSMRAMVERQFPLPLIPLDWLLTQEFDSLSRVRSLSMPMLLLHGTADTVVPPAMSQELYDALSANKTLVWIEGAGHNNMPSVGGDRFAAAIQQFVEQAVR